MTYTVSSGTLNRSIPYHTIPIQRLQTFFYFVTFFTFFDVFIFFLERFFTSMVLFCNKIYNIQRLILPVVRSKVNPASRQDGDVPHYQ